MDKKGVQLTDEEKNMLEPILKELTLRSQIVSSILDICSQKCDLDFTKDFTRRHKSCMKLCSKRYFQSENMIVNTMTNEEE